MYTLAHYELEQLEYLIDASQKESHTYAIFF